MKQIYSKMLLLIAMILVGGSVWAQMKWEVTQFSGTISNNSITINDATWTLKDMTVGSNTNGDPAMAISSKKLKFGASKSQFWSSYTLSTDYFKKYNVTKVVVGCYDNGGTESSISAKQGTVTIGSENVSTTTSTNAVTLNATSGKGGTLDLTFTSTKQASYITSITVFYKEDGVEDVSVTGVALDVTSKTITVYDKFTLTATIAPADATNKLVEWSSDDETVAKVDKGEVTGLKAGKATITVSTLDGSKTASCEVTVVPKEKPAGAVFYESFDGCDGRGGNDGVWSGINTTKDFKNADNKYWTTEGTINSGSKCASIRKDTGSSGLTTPAIGFAGDGHITFNAQAWGTDTGDFYIDIVGGGTFSQATGVSLSNNSKTAKIALTKKSEWVNYDLNFTGLTENSKFRFYMAAGKRGFLDEVVVYVDASDEPTYTPATLTLVAQDKEETYYATFSSDKVTFFPEDYIVSAVGVENGKLYQFDNKETFDEDIVEIEGEEVIGYYVPANTGVLITSLGNTVTYYTAEGVTPSTDVEAVNMLHPASASMTGDYTFYKLAYDDYTNKKGLGFYYGAENGAAFTCKAGTAYLAVPAESAAKDRGFLLNDDEATAINAVTSVNKANKYFNLQGQQVSSDYKGIVISNGKKFYNK